MNVDGAVACASIVSKPVIGALPPQEFTGEGEDEITRAGQILPVRIGGPDQLEIAHQMRWAGTRFPLMRGDGYRYGWFAITSIARAILNWRASACRSSSGIRSP